MIIKMKLRHLSLAALVLFASLGALGILAGLVGLEAKALDLLAEDILLRIREPQDFGFVGRVMSFLELLPSPPDLKWTKNRSYDEGFGHKIPLLREFFSARDKLTTARTLFNHWEQRKRSFNSLFLPKLLNLRLPENEVIDWPVLITAEIWVRTAALSVGYLLTIALISMSLSSRFIASPEQKGELDKDEKFKVEEETSKEKSLAEELGAVREENKKLKEDLLEERSGTYRSTASRESLNEIRTVEELSEKEAFRLGLDSRSSAVETGVLQKATGLLALQEPTREEESLVKSDENEHEVNLSSVEREVLQEVTKLLTRQKDKLGRTMADFAMTGHLEGHMKKLRKLRGLDIEAELRRLQDCGCQNDPLFKLSLRRTKRIVPEIDPFLNF